MIRVFIASPYGDHNDLPTRTRHTEESMEIWHRLSAAGFTPFCPLLSHFLHEFKARPREHWLGQSLAWVGSCDCLLAIGNSEGVRLEVASAHRQHIPVFRSVESLTEAYGIKE